MHRVSLVLLATMATLGCGEVTGRSDRPPPDKLYSYDRDYGGDEELRQLVESFKNYEQFAEFVNGADSLLIYEGLPHVTWESELLEKERREKETVELDGEYLYKKPVEATSDTVKRLNRLVCEKTSFIPLQGHKGCGGFHGDWCLVYAKDGETRNVHICFGCGEVKVWDGDDQLLYCDIWYERKFEDLLRPLRFQRPAKKH